MTSRTRSMCWGFWGFEKSQLVESLHPKKTVDFRSSPRPCCGCRMWWGGRWKSQHWKIVHLPPYVEKPFNSKVIKSFVPKLRSRQVFFVFRDSYVIYIWVMNILCTFHIFMYEYVTEWDKLDKYLDLIRAIKKVVEHEGDGDINHSWSPRNSLTKPGKGTEGRIETIQTTALLKSVQHLKESRKPEKNCYDLNSSEKPPVRVFGKSLLLIISIIMIILMSSGYR